MKILKLTPMQCKNAKRLVLVCLKLGAFQYVLYNNQPILNETAKCSYSIIAIICVINLDLSLCCGGPSR